MENTIKPNFCRLRQLSNNELIDYNGAFYTKVDGLYGYLCVDIDTVKFFYTQNERACCDIVTYQYEILPLI